MKVLILCGVFAKENEQEIISHAKRPVEYSGNIFQEKLINGFRQAGISCSVLSAPFIGSYPNASNILHFKGFSANQTQYTYVPFNNIWGIRNYSRAKQLKSALNDFIRADDDEKLIVVYSPHTPFLNAAVFAKKKDPRIKICLIVPDLPQYMNLNAKISLPYKIGKQFDIKKFNQLNKQTDTFVLLTEAMAEPLLVNNRPFVVVEGIIDPDIFEKNEAKSTARTQSDEKYIVYTGKLNEKFGVKKLIDAFMKITEPNYRLVLCGKGDLDEYIAEVSDKDSRILPQGQVTPTVASEWMLKADVLVNPRENNEEYTKYSFPSKNIEYLASGTPVVAYMLSGMKSIYRQFLFEADDVGLTDALNAAIRATDSEKQTRYLLAKNYLQTLDARRIATQIINLNFNNN